MSAAVLSIAVMALPSAALGARLNDTVTDGNWPWWLIESDCVVVSKWLNVLNGTAFAAVVDAAVFEVVLVRARIRAGGVSVLAEGV
jgi:hypothetical protein